MDTRVWLLVDIFSHLTPHLLEILFPVVAPSFIQLAIPEFAQREGQLKRDRAT